MAVVVGRAEKIMPARQLRGLLGWFNQGECQQGLVDTTVTSTRVEGRADVQDLLIEYCKMKKPL